MSNKAEDTTMKPEGKLALEPRLRFPEFRDAGEWEETKLGDSGKFTGGGTPSKDNNGYWAGKNPWISSSDISEDSIHDIRISRFISDEAIQETATKLVPANSILLVSRVGVGKLAITQKAICTSQDFTNFTPAKDDLIFLAYYLKSLRKFFLSFNQGMAIKGFTKEDVSSLKICLPQLKEQQKIADCLSSLDELITLEAQKLGTLKTHKKGLMQQLFPAEGETLSKLRFSEFRDAGEWTIRKLSEFVTERNQYPKENVPLFSLTIENGVTPKTERYERSFLVNNEEDAYKLVLPNDFAFNPMNLRFGAIGRYAGSENVAVSKYYNIFYCDKTVDSRFCEIYFKSDGMVAFYDKMAIGSLIEKRRVHFSDFLKFKIRFPRLSEQQKIADCLASLDDLIAAQTQKLAALKIHKKGLMQQLFPAMGVKDG